MEKLKQQIIDLCNASGLPLEAIIFVVKDVWRDAEDTLRVAQQQTIEEEK